MAKEYSPRRQFVRRLLALPLLGGAFGIAAKSTHADQVTLPVECTGGVTKRQTAGPFFTPNTPHRENFRGDDPDGNPFELIGFVTDSQCQPLANTLVELWHADSKGRYDNKGYRMRGHQFTDTQGRFLFRTHIPGDYPGRTRHYHVTLITADNRTLTTQLYFPNHPNNAKDWIFDENLLMTLSSIGGVQAGRFDFVV